MSTNPNKLSPEQITRRLLKILPLLNGGQFKEGISQLEVLARRGEPHADLLYNLGLAYSHAGQFDEAVIRLNRSAEINPLNSNTWVGIGTNYLRMERRDQAHAAFIKAIEIDPANVYALKAIAVEHMDASQWDKAIEKLQIVDEILQCDGEIWILMGIAMFRKSISPDDGDLRAQAQELLQRGLKQKLPEKTMEFAKKTLTEIAALAMRRGAGAYRFDVVMYFMGALELFQKEGALRRSQIVTEIALKSGSSGLEINKPEITYTLNSLPGKAYTGMHLLAIMYAGLRQLDGPYAQLGVNFDQEWTHAVAQVNVKS